MNELKNHGLLLNDVLTSDYQLGGITKLSGEPVLSSGDWAKFLPLGEKQNRGFETNTCVSFAFNHCIQILLAKLYNLFPDESERYTAIVSDTNPRAGNGMKEVCEAGRKKGLIYEALLPFDETIKTLEQFFSPNPMTEEFLKQGRKFTDSYKLGYEWVSPDLASLTQALTLSPILLAVTAWFQNPDGTYYLPENMFNNHAVCLYKIEGNKLFIFDSYPESEGDFLKTVIWSSNIKQAMRLSLTPNNDVSAYQQIINLLLRLLENLGFRAKQLAEKPQPFFPELPPDASKVENLRKFTEGIKEQEGWFEGSRSFRNHSPGNLRYTTYVKSLGAVGRDKDNFAIFADDADGMFALKTFCLDSAKDILAKYHNCTILSFCQSYAPSFDNNKPDAYASHLALKVGVDVNRKLKELFI